VRLKLLRIGIFLIFHSGQPLIPKTTRICYFTTVSGSEHSPDSEIAALRRAISESDKHLESTRRTASELEEKRKASEEKHWAYRVMRSQEEVERSRENSSNEQRAA
jgi:hypothetical protein